MVRVLELLHLVRESSNKLNKALIVHMVLSIAIMCRRVDESTPETSLFCIKKRKKKKQTNNKQKNKQSTKYDSYSSTNIFHIKSQ